MALQSKEYTLEVFVAFNTQQANVAINVDTGQPAEYRELLRSSEGPLWDRACAIEFGRLSDGCTTCSTSGAQAIQFIDFSSIPQNRIKDITCCASSSLSPAILSKKKPRVCEPLLVVTGLTTRTMSPLRPLSSRPLNSCSTALSPPLVLVS